MADPVPYELQSKIAAWRLKAAEKTLTLEEMKEAVIYLRAGRVNAASSAAATKRKKAIAAIPSADDMLSDLEGL
jgi:hypothetical protein